MTTLKLKTNLNCGSCVASVAPHLDAETAIRSWRVDTGDPDKVLTVEGDDVTPEVVGTLVTRAGFQVLGEVARQPAEVPAAEPAQSYYPLVLILAYLVGVVALVQWRSGRFDGMQAMNHFMAGFFLVFSFFKLLDVRAFALSYTGYDVVARLCPAYGYIYPFIELALGIAYLVEFWPVVTNLVTLVVMAVSTVGVVQSLLNRRHIRCACLGTVFNLPMSYVTLLEDTLMAAMAAVMLVVLLGGS